MIFKCVYIFLFVSLIGCEYLEFNPSGEFNKNDNVLACPSDKICIPLSNCPDIVSLLKGGTLPVHRFRQAICGYTGENPKVCCNTSKDVTNFNPNTQIPASEKLKRSQCGRSFVNSDIADIGSYPFVALIGFISIIDGSVKYSCTGTIINERTIITTASCALADTEEFKIQYVLVGDYDTKTNPDCNSLFCAHLAIPYNISYIIKHPNYKEENFEKNIALIRLNESIDYTLTAQPVCYSDQQYLTLGSTSVIVGWGKLLGSKNTTVQGIVPMKILSLQDCEEYFTQGYNVELCAFGRQLPCSGFSGAPLLYRIGNCYTLVGMLSYGESCETKLNKPSAFVSIQKYARWIAENSE